MIAQWIIAIDVLLYQGPTGFSFFTGQIGNLSTTVTITLSTTVRLLIGWWLINRLHEWCIGLSQYELSHFGLATAKYTCNLATAKYTNQLQTKISCGKKKRFQTEALAVWEEQQPQYSRWKIWKMFCSSCYVCFQEIIVKAISGILFLLLKHFKLNHVYQARISSQQDCVNDLPLINI